MAEIDERIDQLQARLENLVKHQEHFVREISQIRYEINVLRAVQQKRNAQAQEMPKKPPVREYIPPPKATENSSPEQANQQSNYQPKQPTNQQSYQQTESPIFGFPSSSKSSSDDKAQPVQPKEKSDIEKFIGENLISKIGIVILVLGVAIGAKYAIDNNLISPLTRIILGYVFGFGLLGFAVKLKSKYHNFSAVLLSGAMAIMYFITYFAYSLYELFSQSSAFVLMLIFTVFTVAAAINYSRQVIAHIGLVGAYAVPYLLSDKSGNYPFFFSYIAIINIGILAISLKKYWKPLFYTSFIFTWAIFYAWHLSQNQKGEHFYLALFFLTAFFLIFYLTFIGYKLISLENIAVENIALTLSNSFIFYGLGYSMLNSHDDFKNYLGIFTVLNAAIHFAFAFIISRMKIFPQDLVYLLAALVLTFATISIPVQLDGNWVTLLWTAEAAILFWIGRAKQIPLYENYSYPLMCLATVSLLLDWQAVSDFRLTAEILQNPYPLFNQTFVTSIVFVIAFAFIHFLNKDERFEPSIDPSIGRILSCVIPIIALGVLYNAFRMEIGNYFYHQLTKTTDVTSPFRVILRSDNDLNLFNIIWQINYTMLFLTVLSFVNMKKWKSSIFAFANLALNIFVLVIFITVGLYILGELRESYLLQTNADIFHRGIMHILIRYFSYAFAGGLFFALYKYIRQDFLREVLPENLPVAAFDFVFYFSLWLVVSSELINWMDISGYNESYKLGLSILWGIYALFLIVLGIYQSKKHLRIGAIVLFGITLAKLFLYDIAELDTISKTVVFVSLGILMLIVSFLYNKYKTLIFDGGGAEV